MKKYITAVCLAVTLLCSNGTTMADPTQGQIKLAEKIAKLLAKGDYETVRGSFDSALKQSLSADKMDQAWNALIAQTGEFKNVTKSAGATMQGFDVVEVLCATQQGALIVRVVFDSGQESLNGLWILPAPARSQAAPTKRSGFPE